MSESLSPPDAALIRTCPCCGLAQVVPALGVRQRAVCTRCGSGLHSPIARARSASRTAAIALAALIIYPFAITLPIMQIDQLGHRTSASILDGIATLLGKGELFVGIVVLLCSVVFPVVKLMGLFILAGGGMMLGHHHKAWTYRVIEWTGRWGMLDVLAVAILVAAIKLGTTVELTPGPGAAAFATVVILSLLATAAFDPHTLWEGARATSHDPPVARSEASRG